MDEREELEIEIKDDDKKEDGDKKVDEDSKLSNIVQEELNQFIAEQNDDEDPEQSSKEKDAKDESNNQEAPVGDVSIEESSQK